MATKYELSKTYQYRKVMKPLLERKRRARINKCLDDLKDLMAECLQQQSGDPNVKLEKVDILELTVQHLRKLKVERGNAPSNERCQDRNNFRAGYIQAANEVSRCLAALPNVDVQLGTTLMTQLGLRLNQLEAASVEESQIAVNSPLSINCYNVASVGNANASSSMYSPVSSGYASDNDYSYTSLSSSGSINSHSQQNSPAAHQSGLLQVAAAVAAPVWRPW